MIGDIHGCADELDVLLRGMQPGRGDVLCFLGDYIDRGPASRAVLDLLVELSRGPATCTFLRGNHEDMFLDFLGRAGGRFGDVYLENGGASTLRSYGLAPRRSPELQSSLPPDHLRFLDDLQLTAEFEHSICVHAGLRPTVPLDRQSAEDMLWIRDDFFTVPHAFGKVVLYGHTPRQSVEIAPPYRIGLDTGLVYGGALSCLQLEIATLWQVARHSKEIVSREIGSQLDGLVLA